MVKQQLKNKYGQYFTPQAMAEFMIDLACITESSKILEPSCGQGVFIDLLKIKGCSNITAYEIDTQLAQHLSEVRYESFVSADIGAKFDLVIGNPPYIRWKNLESELKDELTCSHLWNKYFNSLCDYLCIFILKSIEQLQDNGQLIFICPEYWMNTTHSEPLRRYMIKNGYFEEIYHFNETPIFNNATVSVVVFKYIKNSNPSPHRIRVAKFHAKYQLTNEILTKLRHKYPLDGVEYFSIPQFNNNGRWILQTTQIMAELGIIESKCIHRLQRVSTLLFGDEASRCATIGDVCDIGNGMVSGLDKAFQITENGLSEAELSSTINVVKAKDLEPFCAKGITTYIFIEKDLCEGVVKNNYPQLFAHLQNFRIDLEKRYSYNKKLNFWEWAFLRNYKLFNKNEKRIFVPSKERISNKDFFRFSLIAPGIFPTQDVTAIFKKDKTHESIEYILAYLNNWRTFTWLRCNGVIKGQIVEFSEAPIASIPFRMIDWESDEEVNLHNVITDCVAKYVQKKDIKYLEAINKSFNKLFE